jgi:hypothetical protein
VISNEHIIKVHLMKIRDNDIIFLCILLVFGNITNSITDYKIHPLHKYKSINIDKHKYTKITKFLYTSIYNTDYLYFILKVPLYNFTYYNNDDLTIHKSTFTFILNYIFYYIDNEYINCFYIDDYILFIIDNKYVNNIIKKLQIINLDKFYNIIKTKIEISNETNEIKVFLNTYNLYWMKYIGTKQQMIFIIYLCIFSKYNNSSNIFYFHKTQDNVINYIEQYIKSNDYLKNENGCRIQYKIKIVRDINNSYHALNFKWFNIINNVNICNTYLNYKTICKNNIITNQLLLHNYYILFKANIDKHKKEYKCIINNNKSFECYTYNKIGIDTYEDIIPNKVFN